jgi:hypothetical protein
MSSGRSSLKVRCSPPWAGLSFLYGVHPHDPGTFVAIPLILIVFCLAAMFIPVRRAMMVDPAIALRDE